MGIHETTNCPRKPRNTHLHSSKWLGYAREQSALLATRVPEARRTEDLGEGPWKVDGSRIQGHHVQQLRCQHVHDGPSRPWTQDLVRQELETPTSNMISG